MAPQNMAESAIAPLAGVERIERSLLFPTPFPMTAAKAATLTKRQKAMVSESQAELDGKTGRGEVQGHVQVSLTSEQ